MQSNSDASYLKDASYLIEELIEKIAPEQKPAARELLKRNLSPCIAADTNESTCPSNLSSRLGGKVFLPPNNEYPLDRVGRPLLFLGQINFAELPASDFARADKGMLLFFANSSLDNSNPKDRKAFSCIWLKNAEDLSESNVTAEAGLKKEGLALKFSAEFSLPETLACWQAEASEAELVAELISAYQNTTFKKTCRLQLFGKSGVEFDKLQEIAAFASNGISWSEARRIDSHFSHLVDAARKWHLLLKLDFPPHGGLKSGSRSIYLLIYDEFMDEFEYGRSWLLIS